MPPPPPKPRFMRPRASRPIIQPPSDPMRREYSLLLGLAFLLCSCWQASATDLAGAQGRGGGTAAAGRARFGFSAHIDQQRDPNRYAELKRGAGARTVR